MKASTKYEIRRSVMRVMMPSPRWGYDRAVPECRGSGCPLYVHGNCAYSKSDVSDGSPCLPCISKGLGRVG
jgi:hypothetical protein